MIFWRKILVPFGLLYGVVMEMRNAMYRKGWLASRTFSVPIICVGNLSTGGTGKTPHVIHWVNLLESGGWKVVVLSRGYGRKGTGFRVVDRRDTPSEVGDEPLEMALSIKKSNIVVCADRVFAIDEIQRLFSPDVIVMDDGMQHRAVNPGFTICLTAHDRPFDRDWIFPSGNLREFGYNYRRAQAIVVTKSPSIETPTIRRIGQKAERAHMIFGATQLKYGQLYDAHTAVEVTFPKSAVVITGIAHPDEFVAYIRSKIRIIDHVAFRDHHPFTRSEIEEVFRRHGVRSAVITTRKDAIRLLPIWDSQKWGALFVLPVEVERNYTIDQKILSYVESIKGSE